MIINTHEASKIVTAFIEELDRNERYTLTVENYEHVSVEVSRDEFGCEDFSIYVDDICYFTSSVRDAAQDLYNEHFHFIVMLKKHNEETEASFEFN